MSSRPSVERIIGYFDPLVLTAYRVEPDKYEVKTDYFEGEVSIRSAYYKTLGDAAQDREYIGVKFGFRALSDGRLALAAYLPDLMDRSEGHIDRWRGFLLRDPVWTEYEQDDRFRLWVRRYLQGDWL